MKALMFMLLGGVLAIGAAFLALYLPGTQWMQSASLAQQLAVWPLLLLISLGGLGLAFYSLRH